LTIAAYLLGNLVKVLPSPHLTLGDKDRKPLADLTDDRREVVSD
jgi:hypothetical protein